MPNIVFAIAGIIAALTLGLTTDQILQSVYDSANTALKVNLVAGNVPACANCATVGADTLNRLAKWTADNQLGDALFSDDGTNVTLTSGAVLAPDGSAALPSYSFTNASTAGFFTSGGRVIVSLNGLAHASYSTTAYSLGSDYPLRWSSTTDPTASADLFLHRDGVATLAQRNGTNAQKFAIYETFTDTSNYERGSLTMTVDTLTVGVETAGTGADNMGINFVTQGTGTFTLNSVALPTSASTRVVAPFGGTTTAGMGTAIHLGVDTLHCYDFSPRTNVLVTRMAFRVLTGQASAVCAIAVYQDADAGTRLITSGGEDCSASSTNQTTTGLSVQLIANSSYRVCSCSSNASVTVVGVPANGALGALDNAFTTSYGTGANACATGVPPTTTGALTGVVGISPVAVVLSAE